MKLFLRSSVVALLTLLAIAASPAARAAQAAAAADMVFDVRNGDQTGKLLIKDSEVAFESLTDARHSRRWKYTEIRELSKRKKKDMRINPNKGDKYDFQLKDGKMRDQIYDAISQRILAARHSK